MIREKAKIIKKDKNFIYLKIIGDENSGGCEVCKAKSICNFQDKEIKIDNIEDYKDFNENEFVYLIINDFSILKITSIVYGIPFVFTLSGIFLGYFIFFKKFEENIKVIFSFFLSTISLLISLLIIKFIDKKYFNKFKMKIEKYL